MTPKLTVLPLAALPSNVDQKVLTPSQVTMANELLREFKKERSA